ncbi:MAG TPA: MarR family transcriptional regulator [Amycolatopsis sp.]|nr:MarR family transcriptional regulator [Amycolatopsis sp.]
MPPGRGQWWAADSVDAIEVIEVQMAVVARNLELLRRRGGLYGELDKAGYLLLRTLQASGPADIATLAAALGLDPSTVGRQVMALRADGLVERTADSQDRRRGIVSATSQGLARLAHTRERRRERTAELLEGWNEDDLRALGSMLVKYNRAVARDYLL